MFSENMLTAKLNFKKSKILLVLIIIAVFILIILISFASGFKKPGKLSITINTPDNVWLSSIFNVSSVIKNEGNTNTNFILSFMLCGLRASDLTGCEILKEGNIVLLPKSELKQNTDLKISRIPNTGNNSIVVGLYDDKKKLLFAQSSKNITVKNIKDELYFNITPDKEIVRDGDFMNIKWQIANQGSADFLKKDYSVTVNFAGPLEIAQNTGILIDDISRDLLAGSNIFGSSTWVVKDYENRQNGMYNISLLLSQKTADGKLNPVYSLVKQIRWP